MLENTAFFLVLTLVFLFEGLGLPNGRQIALYIVYVWPIILFVLNSFKKSTIKFPKKITTLFIIFLVLSLASAMVGVNVQRSIESVFYYLAIFLVFVYVYNHQAALGNSLMIFTFILTIFFIVYSILIIYLPDYFVKVVPRGGYQYILAYYETHHPLGNWLLIPISLLIFTIKKEKPFIYKVLLFFFLVFFLFSFSRSSYVALLATLIIYIVLERARVKKQPYFLLAIGITLFLLIIQFPKQISLFNQISQKITRAIYQNIDTINKQDLGSRNEYFIHALKAIKERPLWGFGPNNFLFISRKYNRPPFIYITDTSHNLFLDVFSANGTLAGGAFLAIVYLILKKTRRAAFFFPILAMLLIFQTDVNYNYYSYFLYFFILIGLAYREEENFNKTETLTLISSELLFFYAASMVFSNLFFKAQQYRLAFLNNPLNQKVYQPLVAELIDNHHNNEAARYLVFYHRLFPNDPQAMTEEGQEWAALGDKKLAYSYFLKALGENPLDNFYLINDLYRLDMDLVGKNSAGANLIDRLKTFYIQKGLNQIKKNQEITSELCFGDKEKLCQQAEVKLPVLFYQPDADTKIIDNQFYPHVATYTFNKDGLSDRNNYSVKKPERTFRIITLGDSSTFGTYLDTKDNWTEILEEKLNSRHQFKNIDRFEVINLVVNGYDINYLVNRYQLKGQKYQPDLVLWLVRNNSLYQLNELMIPKTTDYDKKLRETGELEKEMKKGTLYPSWKMAFADVVAELGPAAILKKQREYFDEFNKIYQGRTIFITLGPMAPKTTGFLQDQVNKRKNSLIFPLGNLNNKKLYFLNTGCLDQKGHQVLADEVYKYLINTAVISCAK